MSRKRFATFPWKRSAGGASALFSQGRLKECLFVLQPLARGAQRLVLRHELREAPRGPFLELGQLLFERDDFRPGLGKRVGVLRIKNRKKKGKKKRAKLTIT